MPDGPPMEDYAHHLLQFAAAPNALAVSPSFTTTPHPRTPPGAAEASLVRLRISARHHLQLREWC
jgi:hypothetical protein